MLKGTWHLRYTGFNSLENHIRAAQVIEIIPLKAVSELEAVREALSKWRKMTRFRGWDGNRYPREPVLVFEVDPDEWLTKTFVTAIDKGEQ